MKITVSYQTLQLPPPFAFAYTIDLFIDSETVKVKFAQEYLNRDTLSEEEILAEGFTTADDFVWEGKLGKVWADYLSNIFEEVSLQDVNEEENLWIHLSFADRSGLVENTSYWDYELQELVQAIYEASAREAKMHLEFILIDQENKKVSQMISSFEKRNARIDDQQVSWDNFRKIISLVYNYDFNEKGHKNPKNDGLWIDIEGTGTFFKIEESQTKSELTELVY